MKTVEFATLVSEYEAVFLDAYGVLVDAQGALDGAPEGLAALRRAGRRFLIVSNDASRLPERSAARFQALGLEVYADEVVSSGQMVARYFEAHGLRGAPTVVLGSGDSAAFVTAAGAELVALDVAHPPAVVVLCDEGGFDFFPTMNALLSALMASLERGREVVLLLANPDLIYPRRDGHFGFTAGSLARMIEEALGLVTPRPPRFVHLGKPASWIFDAALARVGTRDVVMVGDQLHTDIAGARRAGLASALVTTGVTRAEAVAASAVKPDYLLRSLRA